MKIASEAWPFFFPLAVAAVFLLVVDLGITAAVTATLALFVLYFFRDPERVVEKDESKVVAPGDGTVYKIDRDWYDETTSEKRTRISIFLSIFDVHINRFPVSGQIEKKEIRSGKFMNAMNHLASEENAQVVLTIASKRGLITVKQIVGLIARRIICYADKGDAAVQGERYGLIRFGSRMDITVPKDAEVNVKLKDKVYGGITVLARLN